MKNYMDAVRAAGIGRTPQLCQDALIETLEELFAGKKYNGQQSRKELIAGMSHDLKSPLTSIRAYSEAIRDGVAQKPEMRQRYIETICRKEQEIETMANRLFTISLHFSARISAQTLSLPLYFMLLSIMFFAMRPSFFAISPTFLLLPTP